MNAKSSYPFSHCRCSFRVVCILGRAGIKKPHVQKKYPIHLLHFSFDSRLFSLHCSLAMLRNQANALHNSTLHSALNLHTTHTLHHDGQIKKKHLKSNKHPPPPNNDNTNTRKPTQTRRTKAIKTTTKTKTNKTGGQMSPSYVSICTSASVLHDFRGLHKKKARASAGNPFVPRNSCPAHPRTACSRKKTADAEEYGTQKGFSVHPPPILNFYSREALAWLGVPGSYVARRPTSYSHMPPTCFTLTQHTHMIETNKKITDPPTARL